MSRCDLFEGFAIVNPSTVSSNALVATPAFMTRISSRSYSRLNRSTNRFTEAKSPRSTVMSSHLLNPVASRISSTNRSFAFSLAATSNDQLGGIHSGEMFGSFEADTSVCTGDHDCLSG